MIKKTFTTEVGASIRLIRKSKGITAKELAEITGLAESTVTAYERGDRKIPLEYIVKITDILNVRLEDLYSQSERTGVKSNVVIS